MILGTAAYMAPEQARGKPVDKRSDIWAFGCVLFEMLTGRRAFEGDDTTDTIAAVVRLEPKWEALPADLPAPISLLVKRCLEKDRKRRIGDIAGALFVLNEPTLAANAAVAAAPRATSRWRRSIPLVATAATAIVISAAAWMLRPLPTAPSVTRFPIRLPEGQQFTNVGRPLVAISPDGTRLVYVANQRLYLRSMSESAAHEIPGSSEQQGITTPTFSPDGQSIAFVSTRDRMLKRISIEGGAAVRIAPMQGSSLGISWTDDGFVFGERDRGIVRVSPNGGTPEILLAPTNQERPYGAQLLPGGEAMLVTLGKLPSMGDAVSDPNPDLLTDTRIIVVSLKTGTRKTIVEHGADARYVPTGHIVYADVDTLLAIRFDPKRQQVIGESVPVVQGVRRSPATPAAQYTVSSNGTLVYVPGSVSERQSLAVIDRQGRAEVLKTSPAAYSAPRVSPDGKRIAVAIEDTLRKGAHIWIYEMSGSASIRQLTLEGQQNRFPVWTADGERVAFLSDRGGDPAIWWQRADGTGSAERLTQPMKGESHAPLSWHPREQTLLFVSGKTDVRATASLWTYSLADKQARPFAGVTSAQNLSAQFSPDGRWVVYHAVVDVPPGGAFGRQWIFVRPYPATDATVYPVAGGTQPTWGPDGSELFLLRAATHFVTRITMRPTFSISEPQQLAVWGAAQTAQTFWRNYDITPDGKLIAVVSAVDGEDSASQIDVVLNWFEELKRLLPAR
jgi:eukaryotic-like serine/threonine-protein kinase